jgi:hypothetical protein
MGAPPGFQPKIVGDRTCAMVLARLLEVYETVLLPFGENQRYDLLIDTGNEFIRVQCKTGRLREGSIRFPACSSTYHHPSAARSVRRSDYRGKADVFGVYCPENETVYLVPVHEVGRRLGCLRVEQTKNGQARKIRWARDYEIGEPAQTEVAATVVPVSNLF